MKNYSDTFRHQKKLMKMKDVVLETTLSRSTIYRMIKSNSFPSPVMLGKNRIAFRVDEVDAWLEGKSNISSKF